MAKNATLLVCLMPVEGPQDAGQLTVATGSRVFRLASSFGRFSISVCIGGIVWESNPPSLARRPLRVLKTQEDTSHPSNPIDEPVSVYNEKTRSATKRI